MDFTELDVYCFKVVVTSGSHILNSESHFTGTIYILFYLEISPEEKCLNVKGYTHITEA
jgi:hypothetical protein